MTDNHKRENGIKSLHLAFDVLEAVASEDGEIGVSELATKLDTTKGTVFRHLQTLVERGYLAQNHVTQRYHMGVRSYLLGQAAAGRIGILQVSQEPVKALRDKIGETVVVSTIGPRGLTVVMTLLGKSNLEIGVRVGSSLDLHATAQGKIALAYGSNALFAQIKRKELRALTSKTITDAQKLEAECRSVAALGFASSPNEDTLGINAIAAPIFDGNSTLAGTLAIVGSIQNVSFPASPYQVDAVFHAAQNISQSLGYKGKIPPEL
ncbi:IclR family transcriptional regulator [Brucella gallinifaecis]|uniref:IclR family transcriptional regulator n=1 Tax=Brucella gallinifaecis TaxID=215590 RepID=A0A502BKX0_9HYPH|nr:IclR family transcriptional regulator [Brucella gallinifaecis]TPF74694.1 IclR family transcriptional regulator [Brucella gallinifaecis]